jgi:hypothetical protein
MSHGWTKRNKTTVAYFNLLYYHLFRETKENHYHTHHHLRFESKCYSCANLLVKKLSATWRIEWKTEGGDSMKTDSLPGDGGSTSLWNVGLVLWGYTALYPSKLSSSYSPPWEPEFSPSDRRLYATPDVHSCSYSFGLLCFFTSAVCAVSFFHFCKKRRNVEN